MEIYNFRSYKQKEGQSLDEFVTELRKLAKNCEFTDTDKEINSLTNYTKLQIKSTTTTSSQRATDKGLEDII